MVGLASKKSAPSRPDRQQQPARSASIGKMATNIGLTSERQREAMIERLAGKGIVNRSVLDAMRSIERHRFVDEGLASRAYEDSALPIGFGQTISQPHTVARMVELLIDEQTRPRVLEIGTGCGYQTAVLSRVVAEVYSIERIQGLHLRARANLRPMRLANVRLAYGDGLKGLPNEAPFDGMIIAAAAEDLPLDLLNQLRIGARAIAPLGALEQYLCVVTRTGPASFVKTMLEPIRFVPMRCGLA